MTIQVTQVLNTQSFGVWLERTNQIANIISQNTVTADTTSGGSLTTGNSYVNGFFGANYLVVNTQIRGGNLTTNATITIASNTNFSNVVNIAGLVTAAANLNVTGTANVSSTLNIGGNVSLTTSQVFIGNATVNTAINSSSLSVGTGIFANNTRLIVNTSIGLQANNSLGAAGQVLTTNGTGIYWSAVSGGGGGTVTSVGSGNGLTGGPVTTTGSLSVLANTGIVANSSGLFVNANTGIVANSNGLFVNTAYISSLSVNATNITTGTLDTLRLPATANITTGINVGANLNINTSVLYIGNTSSNLIANSSTLAIGITTVNSTLMSVSAINVSSQVNAATIFTTGIANVNQIHVNNPSVTSIVNGNLTVVGTLQAGTLAYSGTSTGSIIPGTNNSFDIGSTSNVWAKGFFSNLNSNSININGNSSLSGNTSISGILTVTGNSSLSNVSVNGILSINSVHRATNSYTFNNSTSRANVDIFDTATYRSAEYLIQVTDTTTTPRSYQITKMVVLHDNTTPYSTEYSTIYTNQSMGSFDVNIDTANNFQLRFTPSTSNAIVKLSRTAITV